MESAEGHSGQAEPRMEREPKVFNDPIHGHMEFHPILVKIIDTPRFQRLRYIKQLGGVYFVYPGASHNRFEHSLGTAHLAGKLVRSLQEKQPKQPEQRKIDDRDVLCVEIAGLCHDLGHGPFSHMFDGTFIPKFNIEIMKTQENEPKIKKWKHEKASIDMFDKIVEYLKGKEYDLKSELLKLSENQEYDDIEFIKEMINGPNEKGHYKGRPLNKSFLYEIISNKRNGIDVDKFDYFARDCHHLGIKNSFDHNRYIKFAKVFEVDGQQQICTRDKELSNVYEMFHTRSSLYRKACYHKTKEIIEVMITDALLRADRDLPPGGQFQISGAIDNMDDYLKLTDDIFEKIRYSTEPELEDADTESELEDADTESELEDADTESELEDADTEPEPDSAKKILENVLSRKLYKYLGKVKMTDELVAETKEQWKTELAKMPTYAEETQLDEKDFEITITPFDFGQKEQNPMENLYVYDKFNKAFKTPSEQVSQFLLPNKFSEKWMNVYCNKNDKVNVAQRIFYEWCRRKNLYLPPISEPLADGAKSKVFNDPIHGHMEFHPTLVKIIDTPEFQRLRFIKQLGAAYFVYPGASHNRFEHSLGVVYLAGEFLKRLQKEQQKDLQNKLQKEQQNEQQKEQQKKLQKELEKEQEKDLLCVQIAALCLDIGCAPFYDDLDADQKKKNRTKSAETFESIACNLKLKVDKKFIKEMITGEGPQNGRPKEKHFLYDILSNRKNGVGVKLFDSVARDCYNMGLKTNFDHHRFIKFAKVLEVNGENEICIRDKVMGNMFDLWHTVVALHSKAYQHRVTTTIQNRIPVEKVVEEKRKNDVKNEVETDNLLFIEMEKNPNYKDIMKNIHSRKLGPFKHVAMVRSKQFKEKNEHIGDLAKALEQKPEDINLCVKTLNFANENGTNPIRDMHFFDKKGKTLSRKRKIKEIEKLDQTNNYSREWIHVFLRDYTGPDIQKIVEDTIKTRLRIPEEQEDQEMISIISEILKK